MHTIRPTPTKSDNPETSASECTRKPERNMFTVEFTAARKWLDAHRHTHLFDGAAWRCQTFVFSCENTPNTLRHDTRHATPRKVIACETRANAYCIHFRAWCSTYTTSTCTRHGTNNANKNEHRNHRRHAEWKKSPCLRAFAEQMELFCVRL